MITKTLALLLTTAVVAVFLELAFGFDLGVQRMIDTEATVIGRDVASLVPDVSSLMPDVSFRD